MEILILVLFVSTVLERCLASSSLRVTNKTQNIFGLTTGFGAEMNTQDFFFDLEAVSTAGSLFIEAFDLNIENTHPTLRVFTRTGSYVGHENSVDGWIDLGRYSLKGNGKGSPTRLNFLRHIPMTSASKRRAFYLREVDGDDIQVQFIESFIESDGEKSVQVSDENLKVHVGTVKKSQPFGFIDNEQGFGLSGTIRYRRNMERNCDNQSRLTTNYAGGGGGYYARETQTQGILFDIEATSSAASISIRAFDLNIGSHNPIVQVFTRVGSHAGHENDGSGWINLGTYALVGKGMQRPTILSLSASVALPSPGTRQAFYLRQMDSDSIQTMFFPGSNTNAQHKADEKIKIYVGTWKSYTNGLPFGGSTNFPGFGFSGSIQYTVCGGNVSPASPLNASFGPVVSPIAKSSNSVTYVPGDLTVEENNLLLSTGLKSRIIARAGEKVIYKKGSKSRDKFHAFPDGAAVFAGPDGTWAYVSNCEAEDGRGGVGTLIFDKNGDVVKYERLLKGTTMNCGGGKTPFNTWVSCEEYRHGQIWEVDPFATGRFNGKNYQLTEMAKDQGTLHTDKFESVAVDNRDPLQPIFYITIDSSDGELRRFKPHHATMVSAHASGDFTRVLSTGGNTDYLVLNPDPRDVNRGTYKWTSNRDAGVASALDHFNNCEGIEVNENEGKLYFVTKHQHQLFVLDLDGNGYEKSSMALGGHFSGQPDQLKLCILGDDEILYFAEDGGNCGIHARDSRGQFMTIILGVGYLDETTGVAFSPDKKHMYFSVQDPGHIFDVWREDGRPFSGDWLPLPTGHKTSIEGLRLKEEVFKSHERITWTSNTEVTPGSQSEDSMESEETNRLVGSG